MADITREVSPLPDRAPEPVFSPDELVWTEAERRKGQAWGLKTIESFHTHGTPPVAKKEA